MRNVFRAGGVSFRLKWTQLNPNENCVNSGCMRIEMVLVLAALLMLILMRAGKSCRALTTQHLPLGNCEWVALLPCVGCRS